MNSRQLCSGDSFLELRRVVGHSKRAALHGLDAEAGECRIPQKPEKYANVLT